VRERGDSSGADRSGNTLRQQGAIDESESYIDDTFASAKGGGDKIGPTKLGKDVKIMAIVDRHGLPLAVTTHAANHHEATLVQLTFDFYVIEAKPDNLCRAALHTGRGNVGRSAHIPPVPAEVPLPPAAAKPVQSRIHGHFSRES
jgi:hypothetical protein